MRISDWSSDVCSSDLQRANLLSVAQRIWRPEDRSGATDEGPGEGEPAASPCDIGPDAGQADIAGGCPGKLLSPARRRRCIRSEARRVGKECVSPCSNRWSE